MSEDVARAIGAPSPEAIVIDGKECTIRPLSVRELAEIERDCLNRYRKSYLTAYAENAELLGESGKELMREKMEESARWDVGDLPTKMVHDPSKIKLTPELETWLKDSMDVDSKVRTESTKERTERLMRQMVATALDSGLLNDQLYEKFTGLKPKKVPVGYVNWWTTGTYDGMITMIWVCFKHSGITRDQIASEIGSNPQLLVYASREIERLSAPAVGNG